MGNLGLRRGGKRTKKGRYVPKNPTKYIGDPRRVFFMSGWELSVCQWCDRSPEVEKWGSEVIEIPYRIFRERRIRTYYVDFVIQKREKGVLRNLLVEVKPQFALQAPKLSPGRPMQNRKKILEYAKNQSKWIAATRYAMVKGMDFEIWTQYELKSMGIL